MSVSATILDGQKDTARGIAWVAVSVANDATLPNGTTCAQEYIGRTPLLNPDGSAKPNSQLLSECKADIQAQRAAQKTATVSLGLTGTVTL